MDCTIQEVRPGELVDAVEPDEVTLVLGAPGIGTSQRLRSVGRTVRELPETVAVDDELVIVEDFVSAVFDLDDESVATYTYEFGEIAVRRIGWCSTPRPSAEFRLALPA